MANLIISEAQAATLESEVAAILGILEALAAAGDNAVDCADLLRRYAGQVEQIALMAGEAGLSGLQDAGLLFQEKLVELALCVRPLTADESQGLEEWPMLAISYLAAPGDPETSAMLTAHLQNPIWNAPLPDEDAAILLELLQQSPPLTPEEPADPAMADTDEVFATVHSPRPLAGEGLGVRVVDSTTDPLTLTLSPLAGGEGTGQEQRQHRPWFSRGTR